jgi:hypothetical protein
VLSPAVIPEASLQDDGPVRIPMCIMYSPRSGMNRGAVANVDFGEKSDN